MDNKDLIEQLNKEFAEESIVETLNYLVENHPGKVIFTTSFGYEDQVITDMVFKNNIDIEVITLDTGRLFPETYKVYRSTLEKYKKPIKAFFPPADKVEELLLKKGPFSFYESLENRKECCYIRKVIPLKRALKGNEIWITGLQLFENSSPASFSRVEDIQNLLQVFLDVGKSFG